MKPVFADSYYYLALVNRNDAAHRHAVELSNTARPRTITTAWVITELADAMAHSSQRGTFLAMLEALETDPGVMIVAPSRDLYDAGFSIYARIFSAKEKYKSIETAFQSAGPMAG